jgi:hypothetical protein
VANINLVNFPNVLNDIPAQAKIDNNNVETFAYKHVLQRRFLVNVNPTTAISSNILQGAQVLLKY